MQLAVHTVQRNWISRLGDTLCFVAAILLGYDQNGFFECVGGINCSCLAATVVMWL